MIRRVTFTCICILCKGMLYVHNIFIYIITIENVWPFCSYTHCYLLKLSFYISKSTENSIFMLRWNDTFSLVKVRFGLIYMPSYYQFFFGSAKNLTCERVYGRNKKFSDGKEIENIFHSLNPFCDRQFFRF